MGVGLLEISGAGMASVYEKTSVKYGPLSLKMLLPP